MKYAGSDWIKRNRSNVSEFGCKVADILGQIYRGIYHIDSAALHKRTDWSNDEWIEIVIGDKLATYDDCELTTLVLFCHQEAIRCEISGVAPGYIKLSFCQRDNKKSSYPGHHPSIEQAIATHQENFSLTSKTAPDWNQPEDFKPLNIISPADWPDYDSYLLNGGRLEYEDWKLQKRQAIATSEVGGDR